MLFKRCTQYVNKFGKLSSGHRTGKGPVFIPILKTGNAKQCSNYCTIVLISHASKVMLKNLQARFQQYVNQELPNVQAGFRKRRGTRDQTANICWIIEKATEFQINIYICFINYVKAFEYVDHNKLWNMLKRGGNTRIPYLPPKKPVSMSRSNRTRHGTTGWFQIRKGVHQGCIFSSCFFNL